MVCNIDETWKRALKLFSQCKTTYFGLLTSYFVWWQFALVTVGRASLPYLFWNNIVENSWGENEYLDNLRGIYNILLIVWYVWFTTLTRHTLLGTPYQYTVEFFIYFALFQTSYFDKACHNNVDTGCLYEHYADVKYITVWSQHPWVVFGPP